MHCNRFQTAPFSRREMLARCANGFGALALTALLDDPAFGGQVERPESAGAVRRTHFAPKATSVIFLFMDGGPSQVDTFDPKPRLDREHGQPIKVKTHPTQFNNVGNVLKCPWAFRNSGESGIPVSDLFRNVSECVDDMAIVRSMVSNFSEHTSANYFMHTGSGLQGRPSHGAWVTYGLGSECQDLPGFVVLNGGLIPPGGADCFNNGFLPATYQGSVFKAGREAVANIQSASDRSADSQRRKLSLMRSLDQGVLDRMGHHDSLESSIANYELAFRMQAAVPDLLNLTNESKATQALYGLDETYVPTQIYGRLCLLARRLVERGVRFIELLCPNVGADRWDQHSSLKSGHENNARAVDKPIAGLLKDLKARGLLETTLVVWAGEFGRTPMAQGSDGRDHNPYGFSIWLAGGGIKGGTIHGATDDYGYHAVENKVEIHDLHATMLHLLGMDHTRLTSRFGGRDMRLTDVHGEVVKAILA
ncbi:DUF1501 domain-containing protein [Singulisphaera acidiphila]|uniref:Arylsulfatase A family protein n=1 Tax=Singulisphaera acidiphila (strain ATCC BAA-1392 / DSM 18658 / VKM B-2454 / MOB10) TaxID=886293 RepID=L0D9Q3_SINAD|nr:DUF1501 domain-containing protein [Singulisphaera acidiphila]AGA25600.1 hypothetical protein Sinac_1211 [Singulisphaera acidiphila DSM 18658]